MSTRLTVKTKDVRFDTAPNLYGLFFEDINRAADGGLYPEMIRNRAFEDSVPPADCTISESGEVFINEGGWPGSFMNGEGMDDWAKKVEPTKIPGWYSDNAEMLLDRNDVLNDKRLAALKVHFGTHGYIRNIGYDGISVKENELYIFLVFAKASISSDFTVGFYDESNRCYGKSEIHFDENGEYQKYICDIRATSSADKLYLKIEALNEAEVSFGFTSLMPENTYKGHGLREDLVMALKNTHSSFMRFPGGCVVEGINESNALRFSETIGPVWERPSSYLMWHYRTTNGLGYHEYLQLCEDLNMDAMYVCNCGISCQARHGKGFSREVTDKYLLEALGALEYALGDVSSKYGAMRAENGHPGKFPLTYLEIGNENYGPEYNERYELFYRTIKETYPQVKLIANSHVERDGLSAQIVDEHYYNTPEYFVENRTLFDDYDRKGPEIFIGEYAVNGGNTIGSLECALAEAAFLTGVEKNQDIVRLSAYAPLFQNANYAAWLPNLIVFDQTGVYGIPSYHAISLFGKYRGEKVISSDVVCDEIPPYYVGVPGIMCLKEGLYFKNARINGIPVDVSREVYGEVSEDSDAFTLINGSARHRYTGKNEEWNLAFEKFIGAGPEIDNPVLWATFGDEDYREFTFEIDMKFSKDNPVTLSVWNYYPNTDVGCNEPRDNGWNLRSVRNQIWKIADGESMLRSPGYFDKPLKDDEIRDINIDYNKYNHYRIIAGKDGYSCFVNGVLIQEKKLPELPLISEVVTMDDENIFIKLVNIGEEENLLKINLDCGVSPTYHVHYISGKPGDINSFAEPSKISVTDEVREGASDYFEYRIPANCIAVIELKKI